MNNLSEFERIIKDKVDSFEYPYDNSSWKDIKKSVPGRSNFWGYAAFISIAVIATLSIVYVFNDDVNEVCKKNISEFVNKKFEPTVESKTNNIIIENSQNNIEDEAIKIETPIETSVINKNEDEMVENKKETVETIIKESSAITTLQNNQSAYKPLKPNATFICDKKEGCPPLQVKFTPIEISDTIIYSWDFGDGTISTDRSPLHTYNDDGNYSVTLNVKYYRSEAVVANRQANLIKVYELPVAQFSWTNNENSYSFENLSSNAAKYKWILSDTTSNEESLNTVFKTNGKYPVQLVAYNKYGCKDMVTNTVNVKIEFPIFVANSFSPNGDADNDLFGPQVDKPADYYIEFMVFNMKTNQKVFDAKGNANDVVWDGIDRYTNQLAEPGYYYYQMVAKDKYGNTQKITNKFMLMR